MFVETYDNGINGNYLILESDSCSDGSYKSRMIVENHIPSFLDCNISRADGKEKYIYDITSKVSLYSLYEKKEMDHGFICSLISALASGPEAANEYLLPCEHLLFDPAHIYVDTGSGRILWCYYPGSETLLKDGMNHLAEYILEKADHTDDAATKIAYELYKQIVNEDYTFRKLIFDTQIRSEGDKEEDENFIIREEDDFYLPDEDDMPEIPMFGKMIIGVCAGILIIISGVILTAVLYKSKVLIDLFNLREMQIFICLTGAMSVLLPVLVLLKWVIKVVKFRKRLENAEKDIEDIYFYTSNDRIQNSDTGRLEKESVIFTKKLVPVPGIIPEKTIGDTVKLVDENSCENEGNVRRLVSFSGKNFIELKIDKNPFVIGKKNSLCDGVIIKDDVSRVHAKLEYEDGTYYISDLNSTNGTFVNGCRLKINNKMRLSENDEIKFGQELYYFR
ncbi:MAG: FHA domain-containing protein [Lachnospiraceae bacterium]|nr:FHA domain-containing protein [Lachnospiraceae bacterium]